MRRKNEPLLVVVRLFELSIQQDVGQVDQVRTRCPQRSAENQISSDCLRYQPCDGSSAESLTESG